MKRSKRKLCNRSKRNQTSSTARSTLRFGGRSSGRFKVGPIGLALAVEATVVGAGPASFPYMLPQRFPSPMHANRGILRGYAGLARQVGQAAFIQIHDPKRIFILGL